jgi:hypothetical protein
MSSSSLPNSGSSIARERFTLTIDAPADAQFTVFDGHDEVVRSGVGAQAVQLPRGNYSVRVEAFGRVEDQMVRLAKDAHVSLQPKHFSAAPLAKAANSHEYYSYPAQEQSQQLTRPPIGLAPHSSRVFFFIRTPNREQYTGESLVDGLTLHDASGKIVCSPSDKGIREDRKFGSASITADAAPGLYRLRYAGDEKRELLFYLFEGWETHVFIIHHKVPLLEAATILAAKLGTGFKRDDYVNELVDLGLTKLQNPLAGISPERLNSLLMAKHANPMLGLIGAHILLLREQPDEPLIELVLNNMGRLIGQVPDVQALRLMNDVRRGTSTWNGTFEQPPMIRRGAEAIGRASGRRPGLVKKDSLLDELLPRMYGDSPWVTWEPTEVAVAQTKFSELLTKAKVTLGFPAKDPAEFDWVHSAVLENLNSEEQLDVETLAERMQIPNRALKNALNDLREAKSSFFGKRALQSQFDDASRAIDEL